MKKFEDKIALVTGGNSGIGYAAAEELASEGATVIITGRRADAVREAAAQIGVAGMVADQSRLADIDALFSAVASRYGKLDILFIDAWLIAPFTNP